MKILIRDSPSYLQHATDTGGPNSAKVIITDNNGDPITNYTAISNNPADWLTDITPEEPTDNSVSVQNIAFVTSVSTSGTQSEAPGLRLKLNSLQI